MGAGCRRGHRTFRPLCNLIYEQLQHVSGRKRYGACKCVLLISVSVCLHARISQEREPQVLVHVAPAAVAVFYYGGVAIH